ncbi:hypothetical protein JOD63_001645 [Microbacterium terrae]|uniref:primosomal protein n=1 Tax=Microbacterium terrae TaxID=69369 RepID=UPI001B5CE834|nr:primosomal protein [Microbacterium terrae]MBP1077677.1 hypothetical protein [Microbacterium terrae]GLJ99282.1 hypothetical protein GCM10017594_24790 [Microbacterium terrae]
MAEHERSGENDRARASRSDQQRSGGAARGDRKPASSHSSDKKPYAKRDGEKKPYQKRDGDRPYVKRDGDRPYAARDGERKPYQKRDGDRPYAKRDGDKKPYAPRDGERKPYQKRDGDRPYVKRDGDRPYAPRDGERKPYQKRDGDRPYAPRDGERKPYQKRDGDRSYAKRDGDKKPHAPRDGERKPYQKRDGDRPYVKRDGDRPYAPRDGERKPYQKRDGDRPYERRDGDRSGGPRPTRGGAGRPDRAMREGEIRPIRPRIDAPVIPDDVTGHDLHPSARNELKTLSKENAEEVARHLVMASQLIEEDAALAHRHALAASHRAGRIAIVRETLAITAYATGDYALALRELRTYRRISGRDDQIALMVDSERGIGRPDRALEAGRAVDRATLPVEVRVELAIAMSGARLDLDQPDRALLELEIPELDPHRAFEWSPALFAARAAVLEELGRHDEATRWSERAIVAAEALDAANGGGDLETVYIEEVEEIEDEVVIVELDDDVAFDDDFDDDDLDASDDVVDVDQPEDEPSDVEVDEADVADDVDGVEPAADVASADAAPEESAAASAPSIEDEVAEILADAGVDDESDR